MSNAATLGLRIWVIYYDYDLLELRVVASNGWFSGSTECYCTRRDLDELRARLRGFPTSPADARGFDLGTFGVGPSGGGVSVQLECPDSAGHPRARVHMESREDTPTESVTLSFPFEPAMLDSFVEALAALSVDEPERETVAHLRFSS